MCALHIGDADNLDNFIGEIDEVRKFDVSVFFSMELRFFLQYAGLCQF